MNGNAINRFGIRLICVGAIWFVASWLIMLVLIGIESFLGVPFVPFDLVGLLIYLGTTFGGWGLMAFGGLIALVGKGTAKNEKN